MADTEDDGFNEETFKGLGDNPAVVAPPETPPTTPPATPPVELPKPAEEPKKEEKKDEPAKPGEEVTPPSANNKKEEETPKPPETPEAPATPPEAAQPLTKDDVSSVIRDVLNNERSSGKELETAAKEVLDAYYPEGLSNTLIDEKSGKELKTPADVVEASGGQMSTEEAAQWLMNEQYKLDNQVAKIKDDARGIAETTVNFRRDAISAVQKYEPLFKAYPALQEKTFNKLMKLVKADAKKGVILSAPDVMEFYDDVLEPYQQAYEFGTNKPATNPTEPETPEPPKPTAEDRMDISGDGGSSDPTDDPNDFAQQVNKELSKEI